MNHHHHNQNHNHRSMMLPTTRKRKDRDDNTTTTSFYNPSSTKGSFGNPYKTPTTTSFHPNNNNNISQTNNKILAGYMAHEFLTKGTLFGQKFDPARAEAMPLSRPPRAGQPEPEPEPNNPSGNKSYSDVARLLKGDSSGVHIPGVFNPTHLTRWIQM